MPLPVGGIRGVACAAGCVGTGTDAGLVDDDICFFEKKIFMTEAVPTPMTTSVKEEVLQLIDEFVIDEEYIIKQGISSEHAKVLVGKLVRAMMMFKESDAQFKEIARILRLVIEASGVKLL